MCSIQHAGVDWEAGNYVRGAYARFWHFCAVLAQPYANLRKPTLYARPTYTYATVRNRTPVIRNLTRGYANFIRHKYAVPKIGRASCRERV